MATKAAFENGVLGKSTIFALRFDMYPLPSVACQLGFIRKMESYYGVGRKFC